MVFISYSSMDYKNASLIRSVLEENDIICWMAPESIPMGGDYSNEIPEAIEACDAFLLVLSYQSQLSNWVPKELDLAITHNKPIIPFQIDNAMITKSFNFRLTNIQRIEAFQNMDSSYKKLIDRIKSETKTIRSDMVISELPVKYSYYQMLNVDDISQVDIEKLRKLSDVTKALTVPIGINSNNEKVFLNLHQKGDGPHGLIIGPAGSGKSEFIKTLCLSLCLFFSPDDIKLHIIDQKGGGLLYEMEGLPHLGCGLSETTDQAVEDFIQNIECEINRRYQLLEKAAVSNIYQYLKLRKQFPDKYEAMPHLVIVFDELSMLKVEFPDVLEKLKFWGSRMNAELLGVHMLFSTQAFDGLIDDSIWRMIDYRICSTVQRNGKSDNVPVMSSCPGRLYMQARSKSEIQLIQLAYCDTENAESNLSGLECFFDSKSQRKEIIELIKRYEMD